MKVKTVTAFAFDVPSLEIYRCAHFTEKRINEKREDSMTKPNDGVQIAGNRFRRSTKIPEIVCRERWERGKTFWPQKVPHLAQVQ